MPTIIDVAKRANVSISTVSNAFNKPNRVNAKTRERVLNVAAEMGFRPNLYARSLRTRNTALIGIIVSDIQLPYIATLARGIQNRLNQAEKISLMANTDGSQERIRTIISQLRQQGVNAFILSPVPFNYDDQTRAFFSRLQSDGVSLAFISNELAESNFDTVLTKAQEGSKAMVRYLVELGHRKIAFVSLPFTRGTTGVKRWLGYQEGLIEAGLKVRSELVIETKMSFEGGVVALQQLLQLTDPPTAIIAASDVIASGIMNHAHQLGIQIPSELSIVGYNNEPLAAHLFPALTTVGLPIYQMGVKAAELLLERLQDNSLPPRKPLFDYELIVRESAAEPNKNKS